MRRAKKVNFLLKNHPEGYRFPFTTRIRRATQCIPTGGAVKTEYLSTQGGIRVGKSF